MIVSSLLIPYSLNDSSMNKEIFFSLGLAIGSTIYNCTFFKEISCPESFLFPEQSAWPSLLTALLRKFSLPVNVFLLHGLSFWHRFWVANPFFSHVVKFLTKMFFSVLIKYSSVNFTWFALLSHQGYDDRPLFKPEALCLTCYHF